MSFQKMKTRDVTLPQVVGSSRFKTGYDDVSRGLGYNKMYERWDAPEQLNYERGRHVACYIKGLVGNYPPLFVSGRKMNPEIQSASHRMLLDDHLI